MKASKEKKAVATVSGKLPQGATVKNTSPVKEVKEVKAKASKVEPNEVAVRERKFGDKAKIKVLSKENPHRDGSGRAEAFSAVITSKTAGDYYATGNKHHYLDLWIEKGLIEIE